MTRGRRPWPRTRELHVFNRMRIRTKLVVALLVPLLALAVLSVIAIGAANQEADDTAERADDIEVQVEMASSLIGPAGLISAIQDERNNVAVDLIGMSAVMTGDPKAQGSLQGSYDATDEAVADFRQAIGRRSEAVQQAFAPALKALDDLEEIREQERAMPLDERNNVGGIEMSVKTFDDYSRVINSFFDVNAQIALGLDDAELRSGARFIDQISRYSDREAIIIKTIVFPLILPNSQGLYADRISHRLATALVELNRNTRHELETTGTDFYRDLAKANFKADETTFARELFDGAIEGDEVDLAAILGDETVASVLYHEATRNKAGEQLEKDATSLIATARATSDDAASRARNVTIFTGVVMTLAVAITLIASRSIAKPLGRLVEEAETMANESLPGTVQAILDAPLGEDVVLPDLHTVEASGGYEIAELAGALNTVQSSAADLAAEQAILRRNISDSFVNLGRRNQNLLSRQLDGITDMERNETDPEVLEKLFTLDHLATRMRRNAESLLLLAGLEPHRQWAAPVALIDVIRGAMGEVEDYHRVEITRLDEVTVKGSTAADLTHLVAELLENALNFSPPGRSVTLSGAARDHGYMLAIVDNGIGMEADELAQANVRLAGGESFTVAPSRYLGHYVVGIQAARLGVKVNLQETPGGGITAMIDLSGVLSTDESAPNEPSAAPAPAPAPAPSHDEPEPAPAPASSNGHGSGDRQNAATTEFQAPEPTESAYGGTTASGYKKRVRGQNAPRTEVVSARGDSATPASSAASDSGSTAEEMRSMLSGLQAGSERTRSEARNNEAPEET
ncbi:MAG: nitrate- and nitrite sensing domain-containing protein [Microthrixaceae bacterium]|nr:nitrate- and nitrite sensing domain-containing protein [Microthrixaceae bacterium]